MKDLFSSFQAVTWTSLEKISDSQSQSLSEIFTAISESKTTSPSTP